jgi:hypothetical protein
MATEREIQETVARCMSIMVRFRGSERTPRADEEMHAEVALVAGWNAEAGLGASETHDRILRPVASELLDCFGYELGPRLNAIFLEAFEGAAATERTAREGASHCRHPRSGHDGREESLEGWPEKSTWPG